MDTGFVALGLILGLLILLFIGVPIGVSLGLIALPFILMAVGLDQSLYIVGQLIFNGWTSYDLLAIPLFTAMAVIFSVSGIGADLFEVASVWTGGRRGSLSIATILAAAAFGSMCGSTLAAVALFTGLAVPEMLKRGYDKRLATGTVACAGGLAHLIPPSGMAIVYAWLVEVSPEKQMMAGMIPGLILAVCFLLVVVIWTRINPSLAPSEESVSWKERILVLRKIILPIIIVLAVLGSMFTGLATAVESAAIGAIAAFLVAFFSRRLSWASMKLLVLELVKTCGFIFFIIAGVSLFAWVLSFNLIPQAVVKFVVAANLPPLLIIASIQILYIILGMFLNPNSILFITVPVIYPVIIALGLDPVWFGVLLLINMEMAVVTPPVAMALYIVHSLSPKEVKLTDVIKGTVPFILFGDIVVLLLVLFFPQIALWLPNLMK